jgi:SAM-dependent methyltransferase
MLDVSAGQVPSLLLTGERTLPGISHENYWFRRHEAAYEFLRPWCVGADVLEAGCGEGYGAHLLAGVARRVVGLDYDAATARHVADRYPEIHVVRGDLQRLPFADASVEVVVNLQVIEHLWNQPGFLRECARVLRPAGTLIVSTPNRLTFSPGGAPVNPFHTRELSAAELAELLTPQFRLSRMYGLSHGPRLRRLDRFWQRRLRRSDPGRGTASQYGSALIDAQLVGPAATWHPRLRSDVTSVRASDFTVTGERVNAALDLLAIAVRKP